jgi:hypothetical protein
VATRRRLIALLALALLFGLGSLRLLWQWKVPRLVEQRLDRITGHRTSVGAVTLTPRLELIAYDVRIAGAPPFESQALARADQVVVRLRGPGGFWSPSEILIDGFDVDYLGTAMGDNLRGLSGSGRRGFTGSVSSLPGQAPWLRASHGRLRGTIAIPHGPLLAFRVGEVEVARSPAGRFEASLHRAVVDAEGLGSLRALAIEADYDRSGTAQASGADVTLDMPGGGTLLDGLSIIASSRAGETSIELLGGDPQGKHPILSGRWNKQSIELAADAAEMSLRSLGVLAARRGVGLEDATASMTGNLKVDRATLRADFELDARLAGLALLHPSLDIAPWHNQSLGLSLRGGLDLGAGRIDLRSGTLKLLAATLALTGSVEGWHLPHGSVQLSTPRNAPLACAALLAGQPEPVQRALAGMRLDGKLGLSVTAAFDARAWEQLKLDVRIDPICKVRSEATVLANLLPLLQSSSTPVRVPTKLPLGTFHPDFVPLSSMPRALTGAFLTSEDSSFFHHKGFDLDMIRRALAQNMESGAIQRGASTITQQLAKNIFLHHRRTLARKLEEAVLTWRLQKLLSKDRVLELYLNVIELGPGIQGVKQAARAYFGKEVATLTPLECAHLAALTPNPHALARRFRDGQVDEGWRQRLIDLLGMMKRNGRLSAEELASARSSKLVLRELAAH